MGVCVRACVRACVCARACMRACVLIRESNVYIIHRHEATSVHDFTMYNEQSYHVSSVHQ